MLLHLCKEHDPDFSTISVGDLSDYAVEIRYPDEFYIPSLPEAEESMAIAETVMNFVLRKLDVGKKDI